MVTMAVNGQGRPEIKIAGTLAHHAELAEPETFHVQVHTAKPTPLRMDLSNRILSH